jgi:hypothetical protein
MVFVIRKFFFHLFIKNKKEKGKNRHHHFRNTDRSVKLSTVSSITVKTYGNGTV